MVVFLNLLLIYYRYYISSITLFLYISIYKWITNISKSEVEKFNNTYIGKCILSSNKIIFNIFNNKIIKFIYNETETLYIIISKSLTYRYNIIMGDINNDKLTSSAIKINNLLDNAYNSMTPSERILLNNSDSIKKYKDAILKIVNSDQYSQKIEEKNLGNFDLAIKTFLNKM